MTHLIRGLPFFLVIVLSASFAHAVVFDDAEVTPLGNAQVNIVGQSLIVSNIGASGMDGIKIELRAGLVPPTDFVLTKVTARVVAPDPSGTLPRTSIKIGPCCKDDLLDEPILETTYVYDNVDRRVRVITPLLPNTPPNIDWSIFDAGVPQGSASSSASDETTASSAFDRAAFPIEFVDESISDTEIRHSGKYEPGVSFELPVQPPQPPIAGDELWVQPDGLPFPPKWTHTDLTAEGSSLAVEILEVKIEWFELASVVPSVAPWAGAGIVLLVILTGLTVRRGAL